MSGVEDYMSVTSESQYTPVMNFIAEAEANPIQSNSGTRKRKKPLKVKSKSIKNQKVAANNNEVFILKLFFGNSTTYT